MKMSEHICIHEEQIQSQNRKIAELDTRADYKDKRIDELNETMKEVQKSVDSLDKTINDYIIQSINDDNTLREIINNQGNRITALESARAEQWKLFLGFGTILTIISFLINYVLK